MPPYLYWKSHSAGKIIVRPSYLHNVVSYTGKMVCLHWNNLSVSTHRYKIYRQSDWQLISLSAASPHLPLPDINKWRPRQNGCHFADDTFKLIFLNENVRIAIKISLRFVPKGPINNIPALVEIMAWCWSGNKPLSEPMIFSLLTHICITQLQWVNIQQGQRQKDSYLSLIC